MNDIDKVIIETKERILNVIHNPLCVTLTPREKLTENKLCEQRRYFENRLNQQIFKNSYRRFNKKVRMFLVQEYDKNQFLHIHGIIEKSDRYDLQKFKQLILDTWLSVTYIFTTHHNSFTNFQYFSSF